MEERELLYPVTEDIKQLASDILHKMKYTQLYEANAYSFETPYGVFNATAQEDDGYLYVRTSCESIDYVVSWYSAERERYTQKDLEILFIAMGKIYAKGF